MRKQHKRHLYAHCADVLMHRGLNLDVTISLMFELADRAWPVARERGPNALRPACNDNSGLRAHSRVSCPRVLIDYAPSIRQGGRVGMNSCWPVGTPWPNMATRDP